MEEKKSPRSLLEWYDKLSNSYDQLYTEEQARKHQAVLNALQGKKFRLLLDIGCGTGSLLPLVESSSQHIIAMDLSSGMIEIVRRKVSGDKVSFVRAASPWLPVKNTVADCIVSISLIENGREITHHITEFKRVAEPEATIVYTVFDMDADRLGDNDLEGHPWIDKREHLCVIHKPVK